MNQEEHSPSKCTICGRPTHKESKYCIFHAKAGEKEKKEFNKALKKYIEEIKENNLDYNFFGFIFMGSINFNKEFIVNTFKNANFMGAAFLDNADFSGTTFEDNTYFCSATFKHYAYFENTTFGGKVDFTFVTFEGNTYFLNVIFKHDLNFFQTTLAPGKILSLKVKNRANLSFIYTFLENTYLKLDLGKEVFIDFTDSILRNTQIKKKEINEHILQEQDEKYSEAKNIYLLIKNNFHSIGQYEYESWAFTKEKDMERKSYFHFKSLHKWLWSCFLNVLFGYGEKPERVIFSATTIIIVFAFVFMYFGIVSNGGLESMPKYNILKELSMGIRYGDLLVRLKDISLEQIKNCLYFSTVTFTTLGLGDFHPVEGWGRIFVGAEAFIGALMMALFIYTFARRTGGR